MQSDYFDLSHLDLLDVGANIVTTNFIVPPLLKPARFTTYV